MTIGAHLLGAVRLEGESEPRQLYKVDVDVAGASARHVLWRAPHERVREVFDKRELHTHPRYARDEREIITEIYPRRGRDMAGTCPWTFLLEQV